MAENKTLRVNRRYQVNDVNITIFEMCAINEGV